MRGSRSLNTKDLLKHAVLCQFVPSFLRIYPLYKEVTRTSGILIETAWAGAAFNLFLYMLAGHLFGAKSYYKSLHMGKLLCHFRLRLWLSVVRISPRQRADVLAIHKHKSGGDEIEKERC